MDDPLGVGVFQPLGHLANDRSGGRHSQRPLAANQLPQVHARHVFGDQVMDAPFFPRIQCGDELGMVEARQRADFAAEALDGLGRGLVARQDLDGHDAAERGMLGLEDLPHSPLPDRVDDPVGAQGELGAAVEQLFRLPNVEHSPLDDLVGQLPVGGRQIGVGLIPFGPTHARPGLVELRLRQQPAGQGALFEGGSFQVAGPYFKAA